MDVFRPEWNINHRYAVALKIAGGGVCPIQSYEKLEELKAGYKSWYEDAVAKKLTKPIPIEFVDNTGKCKILTDMILEMESGISQRLN
jgi:hypothetical protein